MSSETTRAGSVGTELVAEEFETSVADATVERVAGEVESIVRTLRTEVGDDRLETLLRSAPGREVLVERGPLP
ncbi:MAG: hypothetical protein QXG03_01510 [Halalkalicoccus sp.]